MMEVPLWCGPAAPAAVISQTVVPVFIKAIMMANISLQMLESWRPWSSDVRMLKTMVFSVFMFNLLEP